MDHLITLDATGRMVPADRPALERAVAALLTTAPTDPRELRRAGVGLLALGRLPDATALLAQALTRAEGPTRIAVRINLGDAHRYAGALDKAEPHYREALRLARAEHPGLAHFCLQHLGKHRTDQGRLAEARTLLTEALTLRQVLGDADLVASTEAALHRAAGPG
ncbi:tetratricopeptide repeat protein [Kitasatospora sp. NPDC051853]|uniref:tetratricopeptide repeat protein n=1 Tax=Kitasatospora sp. NPDC051853 TaxID=3364058 RepID=UPI0037B97D27